MSQSHPLDDGSRGRTTTLVIVGVFLALILTASTALGAAVYRYVNGGAITAVRAAISADDFWETTSQTYTAIPGSQVSVNVASGQKAILIITFSAELVCDEFTGFGYCHVAAYVDGNRIRPTDPRIAFSDTQHNSISASFQWVSGVLGPGSHQVTMAGRAEGNVVLTLDERTLTVLRARA